MPTSPPDRYGVIGYPVAHSRSPYIHHLFWKQTAQNIQYWLDEAEIKPSGFATEMKHQAIGTNGPKLATKNQNGHIDFITAFMDFKDFASLVQKISF